MALRTRIKRALTRGSRDDDGLNKSNFRGKGDPNVYQPGEKMPPLKYRRPVAPEHKAHLESFSFAKAWRRRSDGSQYSRSQYSPMGSRLPSRKASRSTLGRKSIDRRKSSRGRDTVGVDSGIGDSTDDVRPERLREDSDEEGDVTNVGLSRNNTEDPRRPRRSTGDSNTDRRSQSTHRPHSAHRRSQSTKPGPRPPTSDQSGRLSIPQRNDQPFSQEDLELALQRSQLETQAEVSDESGKATPGTPGGGQMKNDSKAEL